jgi:hypothetical protein
MSFFRYSMTALLELLTFGSKSTPRTLTYKVLFASPELEQALPFDTSPRLRLDGEIEDVPIQGAWQPAGNRRHYVMVSPAIVKALGLRPGDPVTLRFNLAPSDAVDVPEELRNALAKTAKRQRLWDALTPGRKRGLAHLVSTAKRTSTRLERAALVVNKLETNRLEDLGPPKRRSRAPREG